MRDFLDKVKEVFEREWSGEEKVLIMLCCVLIGVIYGFLISPIKKADRVVRFFNWWSCRVLPPGPNGNIILVYKFS